VEHILTLDFNKLKTTTKTSTDSPDVKMAAPPSDTEQSGVANPPDVKMAAPTNDPEHSGPPNPPDVKIAAPINDPEPFGPPNRYINPLDNRSTRFIEQVTTPEKGKFTNAKLSNIRDRISIIEQRLQMLRSHEQEIVERTSYNLDLCVGLDHLSTRLGEIPFRFTDPVDPSCTGKSTNKNESEMEDMPSSTDFEGGWASRVMHGMDGEDAIGVPLDPMPMSEWVDKFDELFAKVLPGMFGPGADDHQCTYRLLLRYLLRDEFLQLSIEDAIGKYSCWLSMLT
jgi:hypothetical protein